uniref:Uncharacterized protein n=1 Tax=Timema poppense TaxID=170557 RepID=A0A7R9GZ99_TIMPO|nr:unnamed protein product [Timema poppensis]
MFREAAKRRHFINEAESMLSSPKSPDSGSFLANTPGVIGAQEVYNQISLLQTNPGKLIDNELLDMGGQSGRQINDLHAGVFWTKWLTQANNWCSRKQIFPGVPHLLRDPRTRMLAQQQQQKSTRAGPLPEKLSFKEKMKMFAMETGENGTPRDKVKISRAQREIDGLSTPTSPNNKERFAVTGFSPCVPFLSPHLPHCSAGMMIPRNYQGYPSIPPDPSAELKVQRPHTYGDVQCVCHHCQVGARKSQKDIPMYTPNSPSRHDVVQSVRPDAHSIANNREKDCLVVEPPLANAYNLIHDPLSSPHHFLYMCREVSVLIESDSQVSDCLAPSQVLLFNLYSRIPHHLSLKQNECRLRRCHLQFDTFTPPY